ncbi:unnamed protein product, partial [Vitis vinifera]|uniref:Uncharacterized protein n=1 Tax=Vitis vinifera TaxID=29760 RepID=D7TFR3_VITVI
MRTCFASSVVRRITLMLWYESVKARKSRTL